MAAIAQPHRRNPSRCRVEPKRYDDNEFTPLKGSGKEGEINGLDFDQYDRKFNGEEDPNCDEIKDYSAEHFENASLDNLVKKLHAIDKINGHLPELVKTEIKKAAIGDHSFMKDAEFIAPEGDVESAMVGNDDESEGEFEEDYETDEEDMDMDPWR